MAWNPEVERMIRVKDLNTRSMLKLSIGNENLMAKKGITVVHRDGDSLLLKIYVDGSHYQKFVRVKDATTRVFHFLRVPPSMTTCKQAIAWTFGMSPKNYNLEEET